MGTFAAFGNFRALPQLRNDKMMHAWNLLKKIIKLIKASSTRINNGIFMKLPHQNEAMLNAFIKTHTHMTARCKLGVN